ncbi:hypothetical protein [Sulfuriroseicoccus oceanibius]|uniref:Lipoprotein n=1 Tax=Sulfuriroseicoccus oceanibius TaxID=2707525 RepID=A0A6B3LAF5_9BACT|nr:hypothetical protein [Sulfuriroseicoccus oceanibius]QQL45489.1 hypothetical protein G3M56_002555 [Sulfuriroseicoccus oceanibius]
MKLNILKRLAALTAGIATAFAMTSCFEQENNTKLSKDGSGTITETTVIGAQMAGMMKGQMGEGENDLTNEAKYKEKVARMGEGVEYVGLTTEDTADGGMKIVASYKFEDISKLKGVMSDDENADSMSFEFEKGDTNKLTIKLPKEPAAEKGEKEETPEMTDEMKAAQKQQMQMMAGMVQGMKITMALEVDGEIVKTDADHVDGNKITIMSVDVGKVFANEEALEMLDSPEAMDDVDTLRELSKKIDGLKIEADDTITVEFK